MLIHMQISSCVYLYMCGYVCVAVCMCLCMFFFLNFALAPSTQLHIFCGICDPSPKSEIEHDDVIKWKHFPHNWPFVRGIHRSPVKNSPHKGQWRRALMFSWICVWKNRWVNNHEADDLKRHRTHYDVIVTKRKLFLCICHPSQPSSTFSWPWLW